jgi:hypothetical protein
MKTSSIDPTMGFSRVGDVVGIKFVGENVGLLVGDLPGI